MHSLSTETMTALRQFIETGNWSRQLADGGVEIIRAPLPGRAVIGAARGGDTLWLILDPAKPAALDHLGRLIDSWPLEALGLQARPSPMTVADVINLFDRFDAGGDPLVAHEAR